MGLDSSTVDKKVSKALLTRFHWRIVITAGTGFFTDAYDLFIIGVVTAILQPIWHMSIVQLAILNGAALASAAAGAVLFGYLSDKFGRSKLYGLEVVILFIGALLSALAGSYFALLIARIIVGFGIGGDYPSSAVVASEHSDPSKRGFLVLLVFAMQAVGLIVGPLLAAMLLSSHITHMMTARILLGFGMLPAASVFYLRRKLKESPHYLKTKEAPVEVGRVVADLTSNEAETPVVESKYKKQSLLDKKWLKCLVGTAGTWFLMDVALYGNGVSSVMLIKSLDPTATILSRTLIAGLVFLIFAVPGYILAAKYVDVIGRKRLQLLGFVAIAIAYASIGLFPAVTNHLGLFVLVYGLSFFFINFGPNTTTFLIPSEIYPANIRAKAHGISAAIGKVGAAIGVFVLPIMLHHQGMPAVMIMMAIVSVGGFFFSFLLPEMKQKDLNYVEEMAT